MLDGEIQNAVRKEVKSTHADMLNKLSDLQEDSADKPAIFLARSILLPPFIKGFAP